MLKKKIETKSLNTKSKISQLKRQDQVKRIVSKILSVAVLIVGACLLYLCFSNLYQQIFNPNGYTGFFGIGEAIVASDSMDVTGSTPRIQKGDLVFYKEPDISEIEEGDVVVYKTSTSSDETKLIIHRIKSIEDDVFIAQGDANAVADNPMPVSAIVGAYMFKIDDIGVLLNMLSTKWAPVIIILAMISILVVRVAIYFWRKKQIINHISPDDKTRSAINHFFEI